MWCVCVCVCGVCVCVCVCFIRERAVCIVECSLFHEVILNYTKLPNGLISCASCRKYKL